MNADASAHRRHQVVDRFEELRTYIAVAETGGVNAAAAKLGIARSAVSRRLSDLEGRLGTTLVERSTRRFELTAVGQRYYADGKRVIDELAGIEASIGREGVRGSTITVDAAPGPIVAIAAALSSFLAAHPGTTLHVVHGSRRDEPSLTISTTRRDGARQVGELEQIVVCSPSYLEGRSPPEDLADLGDHVAILVDGTTGGWVTRSGAKVAPPASVTVGDDASALALAVAGAGLAELPRPLCAAQLAAGALVEVLPAIRPGRQPIYAFATDGSAAAATLIDHIAANAGAS